MKQIFNKMDFFDTANKGAKILNRHLEKLCSKHHSNDAVLNDCYQNGNSCSSGNKKVDNSFDVIDGLIVPKYGNEIVTDEAFLRNGLS